MKNYLSGIRLNGFLKEELDESSSLEKVYKLIMKLSAQVPQSLRGNVHKIEFLINATVRCTWATEPLSRIATHWLTFQQLYGEIEAALHLEKEAKLAVMRDNVGPSRRLKGESESNIPGILFQGHGRYVNPQKGLGNRSRKSPKNRNQGTSSQNFDPLKVMGCFNYDDPSHTIKHCTKPNDVTKAAKQKMEYYEKKGSSSRNAHIVLFELCKHLETLPDEPECGSDEENGEMTEPDLADIDFFDASYFVH